MNIRQSVYYRHHKERCEYYNSFKVKSGSMGWIGNTFELNDMQRQFLQSDSKYVLGIMPRRKGKTFIQVLDAIYNVTQNNQRVAVISPNAASRDAAAECAQEIARKMKVQLGKNDIIFTTSKINGSIRGMVLDTIYIDEYCFFKENIEDLIIPNHCKIKGCSTPEPEYFSWIKKISESPFCTNIGVNS